jgi:hypothetical protein
MPTPAAPSPSGSAIRLATPVPPAARRRHISSGAAASSASLLAKASGASASARSRSSRRTAHSSDRACRTVIRTSSVTVVITCPVIDRVTQWSGS